jgi:hypothetical protein
LIRFDVGRALLDEPGEAIERSIGERHLQPPGYRLGDLVLHVENVFELAIVAFGPQLDAVLHVAEL